jgi:transposase-like protein
MEEVNEIGAGLEPAQLKAALALGEGKTITEAANEAQVSRQTLYRWLREKPFKAAIDDAATERIQASVANAKGHIPELVMESINCLRSVLKTGGAAAKVRAALSLLQSQGVISERPMPSWDPALDVIDFEVLPMHREGEEGWDLEKAIAPSPDGSTVGPPKADPTPAKGQAV